MLSVGSFRVVCLHPQSPWVVTTNFNAIMMAEGGVGSQDTVSLQDDVTGYLLPILHVVRAWTRLDGWALVGSTSNKQPPSFHKSGGGFLVPSLAVTVDYPSKGYFQFPGLYLVSPSA